MDLMFQPKDIDWLNGYKNKTHTYAVYKRPTSDPKRSGKGPSLSRKEKATTRRIYRKGETPLEKPNI